MIKRQLDLTLEQPDGNAQTGCDLRVGPPLESGGHENRPAPRRQFFERAGQEPNRRSPLRDALGIQFILVEPKQKLDLGPCELPLLRPTAVGGNIQGNAEQISARAFDGADIHAL